jgi:7-cyano-7-deazaguanine synthase
MERENTIAPYEKIINNEKILCWMHGTISNDKEIAKKNNDYFEVDSETVCYEDEKKGLFSYIRVNLTNNKTEIKNKGMGFWVFNIDNLEIFATTPSLNFKEEVKGTHFIETPKKEVIYVAYSGGMDVTLSTYKVIKNNNIKKVRLFYFDYGAKARNEEIKSGFKFRELLKKEGLNVSFEIIDIKKTIKNFQEIYGEKLRLISSNKGNRKETEENLAYVPFRNSLFIEFLVTLMEKNKEVADIVIGLNLTEGQIYGDNNVAWLEGIERISQYGGKNFKEVKILSPYINRTKTNMLKEFIKEFGIEKLKELLDISFSCYYPKNSKPCEKCGSCILRKKAIELALEKS